MKSLASLSDWFSEEHRNLARNMIAQPRGSCQYVNITRQWLGVGVSGEGEKARGGSRVTGGRIKGWIASGQAEGSKLHPPAPRLRRAGPLLVKAQRAAAPAG